MNTCTYLIHILSLIYAMKLLVVFGIKIYRKLSSYLIFASVLCFSKNKLNNPNSIQTLKEGSQKKNYRRNFASLLLGIDSRDSIC